ncbi:hypothetical protein [Symbioplanes lichenis]|uniref:hypothetical protein n=1 Tax=Symbioplanes lichenis TaxID=1629072 RepID=UPI002739A5FD|nr:hypothetical protein [Actinoplanes lichenis]
MIRVVGVELRRSAALGTALLVLLSGGFMLGVAHGRWASGSMALVVAQREYQILLLPLALAAGVWQGCRERRAKVDELFATVPRPRALRVVPTAVALALAAAGGYLGATAGAAARLAGTVRFWPPEAAAVAAVGALTTVAAVWLGLGLGRLLPFLVTAPLAAVAGAGLLVVSLVPRPGHEWLTYTLSPVHDMWLDTEFQTIPLRLSAAQAVWAAALGLGGLAVVMTTARRARPLALLPPVLGAAAALALVPHGGAFVAHPPDPAAQEQVCADGTPVVCVSRVHAALLPAVTPIGREVLGLVARLPEPPRAVHEDTSTFRPETSPPRLPGVLLADLRLGPDGRLLSPDLLRIRMLQEVFRPPQMCRYGVDSAVEQAAVYWLLGREPQPEETVDPTITSDSSAYTAEAVRLWQVLRRLPEREAVRRVDAIRRAEQACRDTEGLLAAR